MDLRVVLMNPTYGGVSGSGRHVELLRRGLQEVGVDVLTLTLSDSWHVDLPLLRSASFTAGLIIRKKFDLDLIHIHTPKFAPLIFKASRAIVTVHGGLDEFGIKYGYPGELLAHLMKGLMAHASAITTVMKYEAERNGWIWIPNMVDLEEVRLVEGKGESYALFVGRNDPVKNYKLFKRVVSRLGLRYKALGVEERVERHEVISYMKSAYCLFITSKWEGMPSTLLEAWASRCPVIATDIPAFRVFKDAVLLAEPTVEALINAYNMLNDVRPRMIEAGERYAKLFDYRNVVKLYIDLYKKVLEGDA